MAKHQAYRRYWKAERSAAIDEMVMLAKESAIPYPPDKCPHCRKPIEIPREATVNLITLVFRHLSDIMVKSADDTGLLRIWDILKCSNIKSPTENNCQRRKIIDKYLSDPNIQK